MMKVKTKLSCPSDRQRSHPKGKIWVSKGKIEYKFQNQDKDYWGWRWSSREGRKIGYCTNIRRIWIPKLKELPLVSHSICLDFVCLSKSKVMEQVIRAKECKSLHSLIFQYINTQLYENETLCLIKLKLFKSTIAHQIHF